MKVITVFGSSHPKPGSADYEQAREVGRLLAGAGVAVMTGGYEGTMSGVSQGAAEAGGHVIGIGSTRIDAFRGRGLNQWVMESTYYDNLADRLLHVVRENDGMIGLPGGIGTISEVTLAWSLLQVKELSSRPVSLLGSIWKETIDTFYDPAYLREEDMELLHFADCADTAVSHIIQNL